MLIIVKKLVFSNKKQQSGVIAMNVKFLIKGEIRSFLRYENDIFNNFS